MAQLRENIDGIVAALYTCTRSDGDCSPLSREELRQLIEQEFADAMENPQDPKTVKKVLCLLDDDSNCKVDFSELLSLVFRVAKACYKPPRQHQAPEDGQEPTGQEKAAGEPLLEPRTAGRVSRNREVPEQGVNNEVQDAETQDPVNHQTQEGDTQEQDQDTQEGETPKEDPDTRQTQEGETPEQDEETHQTPEGDTQDEDPDTRQTQEGETPEQDKETHQTQEGDIQDEDPDTHQTQEVETPEQDEDTHQDDRIEAPEGDPKRGEILDTERDRNTHKAEETETPKQDPKTHQIQETVAPGQGSSHHQSLEMESTEQDLNCSSETRGRDPNNKTQVCEAPQQDPNPSKTQKLLPPQQGASPHWDPTPQGTRQEPAFHQPPESKVLELQHGGAEAPSRPAQRQHHAHGQSQPAMEQQLLQTLYQWPLQK
ncbi:CRNN protein, partial [Pterocles burchelli]|nr:CRNN protein [Pterocles burchelli]